MQSNAYYIKTYQDPQRQSLAKKDTQRLEGEAYFFPTQKKETLSYKQKRRIRAKIQAMLVTMVGNIVYEQMPSTIVKSPYPFPPGSNDGWDKHNVTIVNQTIPSDIFDTNLKNSWFLPNMKTYGHESDIPVHLGTRIRGPKYEYPEIQMEIGYRIMTLLGTGHTLPELTGIYALKNKRILSRLLEELSGMSVSNPQDLADAKVFLSNLYFAFSSDSPTL